MSLPLARLGLGVFAPRVACRTFSSSSIFLHTKDGSQRPPQAAPDSDSPKSSLDFLDLLARPPQNTPYSGGGGRSLRQERFPSGSGLDDDRYTRPLLPGSTDQIYHLYVKSTNNNTLITLTDPQGNALKGGSASGGTVGFKGVAKSGYEAGYQCALRIFSRVKELRKTVNPALGELKIELHLNGMFGQGREAVYRALMTQDGEHVRNLICRVTDKTPIRVGGTRPKKRRIL